MELGWTALLRLGVRRRSLLILACIQCLDREAKKVSILSSRTLRTDHLDLYQIYFTAPRKPIDGTLRTLGDLVRSGKVRCTGFSRTSRAGSLHSS